jgi:hypothetical protein
MALQVGDRVADQARLTEHATRIGTNEEVVHGDVSSRDAARTARAWARRCSAELCGSGSMITTKRRDQRVAGLIRMPGRGDGAGRVIRRVSRANAVDVTNSPPPEDAETEP